MKALLYLCAAIVAVLLVTTGLRGCTIHQQRTQIAELATDTTQQGVRLRSLQADTTLALAALRRWDRWQDSVQAQRASERAERLVIEGRLSYWRGVATTIKPDTLYATCDSVIHDIDFADWLRRVRPLSDG